MSLVPAEVLQGRSPLAIEGLQCESGAQFLNAQLDLLRAMQELRATAEEDPESLDLLGHLFAEELLGLIKLLDPASLTPTIIGQMRAITTKHAETFFPVSECMPDSTPVALDTTEVETPPQTVFTASLGEDSITYDTRSRHLAITRTHNVDTARIKFTPKVNQVFATLWQELAAQSSGALPVLSKDQIYAIVCKDACLFSSTNAVEVSVRRIREQIEEYLRLKHEGDSCFLPVIVTIRQAGYYLVSRLVTTAEVTPEEVESFKKLYPKRTTGNIALVIAYKNAGRE